MNFKRKIQHFLIWWSKLGFIKFVGFGLLLNYAVKIALSPFAFFLNNIQKPSPNDMFTILGNTFLAPLIETLIFQAFIIYFIKRFLSKRLYIQIFLSAFIFGILHYYSLLLIISAILVGAIFSTAYILYKRKRSWEEAFIAVFLIHAVQNTISVLLRFFIH